MADAARPPDHEVLAVLREADDQWLLRTRVAGRDGVTRVLREPVATDRLGVVLDAVHRGALAVGVPWGVRRVLDGYAARAGAGAAGLPEVLAAGLIEVGGGAGLVYLTRAWVAGHDLASVLDVLDAAEREAVALALARRVAGWHAAGLVVQDLKPGNLIVATDGALWFVDLESLRRLDPRSGVVRATHYSEGYAAPEQVGRHQGGAAADVWSLGVVLRELLDPPPPVVDACLTVAPELRPAAATVAAALAGEPLPALDDATVRVPEPVAAEPTPPITDVERAVAEPVVHAPRRGRGWWAAGLIAGVAVAGIGLGGVVAAARVADGWQARDTAREAAAAELAAARAGLERHKTVAAENNAAALDALLHQTAAIAADPHAPEGAQAVDALARVWAARWHFHGASWDGEAHAALDAPTVEAAATGSAEGLLARGLHQAAACRLAPASSGRDAACAEASARLDGAVARAEAGGEGWLVVEARWGGVSAALARARRGDVAALPAALASCDAAAPVLSAAPVNGVELVQDCLAAAGLAGEAAAWSRWARWLVERDEREIGAVARSTVGRLVGTALPDACAGAPLGADGLPVRPTPGGAVAACEAAALMALGCPGRAEAARTCETSWLGVCVRYREADGVPWPALLRAGRALDRRTCALDLDAPHKR